MENSTENEKAKKTLKISQRDRSKPHYDAMGIMLDRIRSCSKPPAGHLPDHLDDDVFLRPTGRRQPLRSSVIKGNLYQSATANQYSIPVSNRFEALGN